MGQGRLKTGSTLALLLTHGLALGVFDNRFYVKRGSSPVGRACHLYDSSRETDPATCVTPLALQRKRKPYVPIPALPPPACRIAPRRRRMLRALPRSGTGLSR